VIAVFLFIRTQKDLRIYALMASLNVAGAGLLNMILVRKHISLRCVDWKEWNVWRHFRPVLLVFSLGGVVSIYTSLDRVMLGYLANDAEVGFYSAADRMVKAVVMAVTSVGVVLLPRVSYYIQSGKLDEYGRLTTTALRFIAFLSFPAAAGLIAVAGPLVLLLAGRAFEPTIPLVQIMGLNVALIALGNIMGYQVLYPQGKERLLLYSAGLGAVCNLALNCLLIPRWHALGAACSTLVTEMCVTGARIVLSRAYWPLTWPIGSLLKYAAAALAMGGVVLLLGSIAAGTALRLSISVAGGAAFYLVALWMLRDSLLSAIWNRLAVGAAAAAKAARAET
jgi:O-antigen/teichoic acid export membrane protein